MLWNAGLSAASASSCYVHVRYKPTTCGSDRAPESIDASTKSMRTGSEQDKVADASTKSGCVSSVSSSKRPSPVNNLIKNSVYSTREIFRVTDRQRLQELKDQAPKCLDCALLAAAALA